VAVLAAATARRTEHDIAACIHRIAARRADAQDHQDGWLYPAGAVVGPWPGGWAKLIVAKAAQRRERQAAGWTNG
jgi:hypothetical protein